MAKDQSQQTLLDDIRLVGEVFGDSPTQAIRQMETMIPKLAREGKTVDQYLREVSVSPAALVAAMELKQVAAQINVIMHALGVLLSLPYVLEEDEIIDAISLGAGNTGKRYDLVTDRRVAEFKFIGWQGGAESIRQNNVFKDFLNLLWDDSGKRKQLFLTGTAEAIAFLKGGRALSSVLSKDNATRVRFEKRYGEKFEKVRDFYAAYHGSVQITDLQRIVPAFRNT